jgi:hypothetical protein
MEARLQRSAVTTASSAASQMSATEVARKHFSVNS